MFWLFNDFQPNVTTLRSATGISIPSVISSLSVTLVHFTQRVEFSRNISAPRCSLDIWLRCEVNNIRNHFFSRDLNGKGNIGKWIYIAPFCRTSHSSRSVMDHTKLHHTCLYLVSVPEMAPPLTRDSMHVLAAYYTHLSTPKVGRPIANGYPHWSPVSCRSSAAQGKFADQRPTFYHCAKPPTNVLLVLSQLKSFWRSELRTEQDQSLPKMLVNIVNWWCYVILLVGVRFFETQCRLWRYRNGYISQRFSQKLVWETESQVRTLTPDFTVVAWKIWTYSPHNRQKWHFLVQICP